MPTLDESFAGVRDALADRYGQAGPVATGRDPFETLLATALDRAIEPRKRDLALAALREEGLLEPQSLAEADPAEIEDALASAGVPLPRPAIVPLRRLARWLVDLHQGATDDLIGPEATVPASLLRDELLAINGVGPATADALLLFGLNRAAYPVDRATYRILVRHGWLEPEASYDEARDTVERLAPDDPDALARLSTWFERLGRDVCRATTAKCDRCPLRPYLPEGGPIDPSG